MTIAGWLISHHVRGTHRKKKRLNFKPLMSFRMLPIISYLRALKNIGGYWSRIYIHKATWLISYYNQFFGNKCINSTYFIFLFLHIYWVFIDYKIECLLVIKFSVECVLKVIKKIMCHFTVNIIESKLVSLLQPLFKKL